MHFYASPDLKQWKYVGEFGGVGAMGGLWECPDLFPLAIEGGGTKWVLIVNINPGGPAGGSGCQYFVGEFDGAHFKADPAPPRSGPTTARISTPASRGAMCRKPTDGACGSVG